MRAPVSPGLRSGLAIALLIVLVPLPSRPAAYGPGHFLPPAADLAVIVLALCLAPRAHAVLRAPIVAVLMGLSVLRLADLGMIMAFQRRFNPVLDLHLLISGWEIGAATFGTVRAACVLAAIAAVILALGAALWWALGGLHRLGRPARLWLSAVAGLLLVLGPAPILPREIADRSERLRTAFAEEARFAADLRTDDLAAPDFAALAGRDVVFVFVESYGRAWLDAPLHRETAEARLAAAGDRLDAAGLSVRSGWVRSPTRGGQSWLAHGAVMSGLWTASQGRYDAVLASGRRSLNQLFGAAGWRTSAVMPAITRDWPEARWFGYDAILDEAALGYRGMPFDWVTMPDQYTLSALDRLARGDGPAMVEVALISSHAPWTPLPDILPWDEVGDGSTFDGNHRHGAAPKEVWSSPDTIRAAWSASLDYALEVVAQWAARSAGDALVVVLGDHQPAPLVAGEGASAAVPIHVIARDAALLERLPGAWSAGMRPSPDLPERSMADLRSLFATCFSSQGCGDTSRPPR